MSGEFTHRTAAMRGLTLVELIISIALMSLIAVAAAALFASALQAQAHAVRQGDLHREAMQLMGYVTGRARHTTHVLEPNADLPETDYLLCSENINNNNNYYQNDPLFPLIDEDFPPDRLQHLLSLLPIFGGDPLDELRIEHLAEDQVLQEVSDYSGETVQLSSRVLDFTVTFEEEDASGGPRLFISLTVGEEAGATITLNEYVYVRNMLQRTGRKLR